MADFFARMSELEKMVGKGTLSGVFGVDGGERSIPLEAGGWQDFMGQYGPKKMNIKEPGEAHAVQNSFVETQEMSLKDIAETVLSTGPGEGMERHVERMDETFKRRAPRDTGQYADSTARFVVDAGQLVYERYGAYYGHDPARG